MTRLSVDKISAGRAVLVNAEGDAWEIPASALPAGTREGDLLDIRLRLRKKENKKLVKDIEELQEKLLRLKQQQQQQRPKS